MFPGKPGPRDPACRQTMGAAGWVDIALQSEYGIRNSNKHDPATCLPRGRRKGEPVEHSNQRIRVIVAKVGLDGHDRGVKIVARTLRDAGMDVIYTGLHRTPDEVVEAAIQEDVDVIGISILSGAHMTVFPRLIELLKARGADDILVVGGGVIPDDDLPRLRALGVRELMLQDTPPAAIVEMVRRVVAERGPR
jgi:methylmalonyl-CoA mutase cobalamin-binding domain/chain